MHKYRVLRQFDGSRYILLWSFSHTHTQRKWAPWNFPHLMGSSCSMRIWTSHVAHVILCKHFSGQHWVKLVLQFAVKFSAGTLAFLGKNNEALFLAKLFSFQQSKQSEKKPKSTAQMMFIVLQYLNDIDPPHVYDRNPKRWSQNAQFFQLLFWTSKSHE